MFIIVHEQRWISLKIYTTAHTLPIPTIQKDGLLWQIFNIDKLVFSEGNGLKTEKLLDPVSI